MDGPATPGTPDPTPAKDSAQSDRFPCPNCGGELTWEPGAQKMRCQYCDSLVDVPQRGPFEAEEHDLMAFLEKVPRAEGYGVTLQTFTCKQCGATVQAPPTDRRDITCPFCASSYVAEASAPAENVIKPEALIPFKVDKKQSQSTFQSWLGTGWFRPNDLKNLGRLDRVSGLYLPFFTFDAHAESDWTAMAGYYYYVTENVEVTGSDGKTRWEQRQVQKVRWEPASGDRADDYDDVLVPGVQHERLNLILKVYPYDTQNLTPYSPMYLSGFGILNADMPLKMVYQIAKQNMEADQVERCSGDVPGDTQRDLRVRTSLSDQTFKHLLCPLWIGSFRYKGKVFPFVINGQTGKVYGEKPWSWVKIFFASLFAGAVLTILIVLLSKGGH
jgi:hypothetical protein